MQPASSSAFFTFSHSCEQARHNAYTVSPSGTYPSTEMITIFQRYGNGATSTQAAPPETCQPRPRACHRRLLCGTPHTTNRKPACQTLCQPCQLGLPGVMKVQEPGTLVFHEGMSTQLDTLLNLSRFGASMDCVEAAEPGRFRFPVH